MESQIVKVKIAAGIFLLLLFARLVFEGGTAASEGVYHPVKRGDTLWGISRTYGVSLEDIRRANRKLARSNVIREGQEIFIPGRDKTLIVEPLNRQLREILQQGRSERWEYIVIHHSATETGSERIFDRYHRNERNYRAMGYHFVLCNGTDNTEDGEIETGFRWERQWDGAHVRGGLNKTAIGICLVGNFEYSEPTEEQTKALVSLAVHLALRYQIPLENIRGHGDFAGNETKCPGKKFPWEAIKEALSERGVR